MSYNFCFVVIGGLFFFLACLPVSYTHLSQGWKEIDRLFRTSLKTDQEERAGQEVALPPITKGQVFEPVEASVTEHFTSPPKPYTEDTLLSAMERAGSEDIQEDAERKGLGTPATRASIIEKLVSSGFAERKGKNLIPTKDGINPVSYTHLLRRLPLPAFLHRRKTERI